MALDAVAKEVSGMALASGVAAPPPYWGGETAGPTPATVAEMLASYRKDLARVVRPVPRPFSVSRLDPDLVANRSMALHCKLSVQASRNADREYEQEASWIRKRMQDLLSHSIE